MHVLCDMHLIVCEGSSLDSHEINPTNQRALLQAARISWVGCLLCIAVVTVGELIQALGGQVSTSLSTWHPHMSVPHFRPGSQSPRPRPCPDVLGITFHLDLFFEHRLFVPERLYCGCFTLSFHCSIPQAPPDLLLPSGPVSAEPIVPPVTSGPNRGHSHDYLLVPLRDMRTLRDNKQALDILVSSG